MNGIYAEAFVVMFMAFIISINYAFISNVPGMVGGFLSFVFSCFMVCCMFYGKKVEDKEVVVIDDNGSE